MDVLHSLTPLDWGILGILLGAFLIGWYTGIIRFLTGFLSFFVAVAVAGRYSDQALQWLNDNWGLQGQIEGAIARRISIPADLAVEPHSPVSFQTALSWLKTIPIPPIYKQPLAQQVAQWSSEPNGQTVMDYLVQQIAAGLLSALVFALLVAILSFLISRLGRFFADQVQAIPIVGTADRMLGAVALLLEAALILSFILIWLVPALSLYGVEWFDEAIGQAKAPSYLVLLFEWTRGLLLGGGTRLWNG